MLQDIGRDSNDCEEWKCGRGARETMKSKTKEMDLKVVAN